VTKQGFSYHSLFHSNKDHLSALVFYHPTRCPIEHRNPKNLSQISTKPFRSPKASGLFQRFSLSSQPVYLAMLYAPLNRCVYLPAFTPTRRDTVHTKSQNVIRNSKHSIARRNPRRHTLSPCTHTQRDSVVFNFRLQPLP